MAQLSGSLKYICPLNRYLLGIHDVPEPGLSPLTQKRTGSQKPARGKRQQTNRSFWAGENRETEIGRGMWVGGEELRKRKPQCHNGASQAAGSARAKALRRYWERGLQSFLRGPHGELTSLLSEQSATENVHTEKHRWLCFNKALLTQTRDRLDLTGGSQCADPTRGHNACAAAVWP